MPTAAAPDTLAAVVTTDCNLRCSYCFQDRKQRLHMSWPTMSAAIELLLGSRRRRTSLSFLGGEPLLAFPLIVRAVARANRRQGPRRRIQYALTTNGLLLTPRRMAFLERHRFNLQISLDGIEPAQALRSATSFAILDRLLDHLARHHRTYFRRRVSVAATVTAPAIPCLAESFDYLLARGVRQIGITAAMGHGRLSKAQVSELHRQFGRVFDQSLRHYRTTGEVPLTLFQKRAPDPRTPDEDECACAAGVGNNLTVDVDGEVYPCALLIRSCQTVARPALARRLAAMSLGPVADRPGLTERLAQLPAAARAAGIFGPQSRKRSSLARCAACRYAAACFVCPIACAKNPDSADANRIPDFQCAFNRIVAEYRRRFPIQH